MTRPRDTRPPNTRPRGTGRRDKNADGFSIVELIIALAVTLVVMGLATTLVAQAFNVRRRENQRSDALSDAQRALNAMSREIANAGFGMMGNGIVAQDSGATAIRVRANLNSNATINGIATEMDEDVKYMLHTDTNFIPNRRYLVRRDIRFEAGAPPDAAQSMVLANIDAITIRYFREQVSYTSDVNTCNITGALPATVPAPIATDPALVNEVTLTPQLAGYVVISICVDLPAFGTPRTSGYQPASRVQLVSDVNLRNATATGY
jgi:type II secretory pathway pseudopilin PulG